METELKHSPRSHTSTKKAFDRNSTSSLIRPLSPIKHFPQKTVAGTKQNQALTILNTLHPELFVPNRQMGWNMFDTIRTSYPFVYRINDGMSNNTVLQRVCEDRGWQEFKEVSKDKMPRMERDFYDSSNWNLWWSYNFYQGSPYRTLKCWQYTNHNPRGFQFCNKAYLTSFLRKMNTEFGEVYNFSPKSFIMPEDYIKFVSEHSKRQERECPNARNIVTGSELTPISSDDNIRSSAFILDGKNKSSLNKSCRNPLWIIKPIGKSQGKGIILTTDIGLVASSHRCVVQEYIARPHLIGGYKWDIRIYCCITSTDPLVIYMYREGLCRFATEKFDLANLEACFSHLTNASLNKTAPEYPTNKEVIGSGCKWSLKQLRGHLKKSKYKDWILWQKIMALVLLTVVGEGLKSGYMFPANRNCFDFFGFDILVDSNFEPWLLEVNYSPGLGGDCEVDEIVKKPMLNELFDLLGFPNSTSGSSGENKRPSSATSNLCSTPNPSSDQKNIHVKPKLALDCTNVDVSCKARLKQASLIYSQDLVLEYFGNHCRDPKFRLSPTMKILYERKISHARRKKRYEKYLEQARKKEEQRENDSKMSDEDLESGNKLENNNLMDASEEDSSDEEKISRPSTANSEQAKKSSEDSSIYIQRQDWTEPPFGKGNWCLVYPCKAFPYRSPYRSALGDLRGVVKAIQQYLHVTESVVQSCPGQNDEFYSSRVKALCGWNIDVWFPPGVDDDESIVPIMR